MQKLQFGPEEQEEIFKTVAAVIHLGNIQFKDDAKGTGSEIVNQDGN
jgi:myosin heavy subunit